ncbi:MAG: ATP-grasp domain-containing protein [Myxococcales bacterium]|nr:ATP-grasp domain-containing protein [Myxococcales bacterium]
MRILVANRGEIARRVFRTARRMGCETVAVFADPDRGAPFAREATLATRLGPAALDASYLSIEALLEAAARTGATAIHPGYGFLAESASFAEAVVAAGLVWIGPHARAIERMGSKIEARAVAEAARVPTIPGYDASQADADLAKAAKRIGFPVLIKAAAGGGGKGIRIVRDAKAFASALAEARGEAERSFGDAKVLVERFVECARHVEVQVVGDRNGNVIDLGTRECSVQRRYQKLLEEAPAPNLPDATREGLRRSARELARAMAYDSTGTVEYVVDDETGDYYFLEMNTRLQVEHPVTEAITGLDLVELQIRVARGEALPLAQEDVRLRGHAFEVRINAEDAGRDFAPQTGRVTALRVPEGVRFESAVEVGSEITPHYDAMVAKLVVEGPDREVARARLERALDGLLVGGLVTNAGFQRWLVATPAVVAGRVTTRLLDEQVYAPDDRTPEAARLAAAAWRLVRAAEPARAADPWRALGDFRLTPHETSRPLPLADRNGALHMIESTDGDGSAGSWAFRLDASGDWLVVEAGGVEGRHPIDVDRAARRVVVGLAGESHAFRVLTRSEAWAPDESGAGHGDAEAVRSPFPAVVTETPVATGDRVATGDVVVVIEAMKMLHALTARGPGLVARVHVAVGESVEADRVLVSFEAPGEDAPRRQED